MKACNVLDASLAPVRIASNDPAGAGDLPVADVQLDSSVTAALDAPGCDAAPHGVHAQPARRPSRGLCAGRRHGRRVWPMARIAAGIAGAGGIRRVRSGGEAAGVGMFAREIEHIGETSRLAAETGSELKALGYHAQVTPHEGHAALFQLDGDSRRHQSRRRPASAWRHERDESTAILERVQTDPGGSAPTSCCDLRARHVLPDRLLRQRPQRDGVSGAAPNVYAVFGIPMPLFQQRASATMLDSNADAIPATRRRRRSKRSGPGRGGA